MLETHLCFSRLYEGFVQAYRTLVPEQKDRIPMSPEAAAFALITALPILFMAYLARRPDTYLIRLLLIPLTIMGLVSSGAWITRRDRLSTEQVCSIPLLLRYPHPECIQLGGLYVFFKSLITT